MHVVRKSSERKLLDVEASLAEEREELRRQLRILGDSKAPDALVHSHSRSLCCTSQRCRVGCTRHVDSRGLLKTLRTGTSHLAAWHRKARAFAGNPDGDAA